ncbi:MAG TPA: hypothetical protein VG501_01440, partial [Rhizomicrobium sp.]|nr:hypothetical protein [Rhizomicrobium sp.]
FDFSRVMDRSESLRQNPGRAALMCQAQVRQIAPGEVVIPTENGFHLVVRTRSGAAAGALASEINRALLRRLFGAEAANGMPAMFHAPGQSRGQQAVLPLVRNAPPAKRPVFFARDNRDNPLAFEPRAQSVSETASTAASGWPDFKPGYIPVFHLRQKASPMHLCGAVSFRNGRSLFGADALRYCHPDYRPSMDMAMLRYGLTLLPQAVRGKDVSGIVTGASYETLAWSKTRQAYLEILRTARLAENAPFIVKLDDVPRGTTARSLADILAVLKPLVGRVFIHLPDRDTSLAREACLGAAGFCTSITPKTELPDVAVIAQRLEQVAFAQRALSCILGAGDNATLRLLHGTGCALAAKHPDHGGIQLGANLLNMTSPAARKAA